MELLYVEAASTPRIYSPDVPVNGANGQDDSRNPHMNPWSYVEGEYRLDT